MNLVGQCPVSAYKVDQRHDYVHREISRSTGGSRLSGFSTEYSNLVWHGCQRELSIKTWRVSAYDGTCDGRHTGTGSLMGNRGYGLRAPGFTCGEEGGEVLNTQGNGKIGT